MCVIMSVCLCLFVFTVVLNCDMCVCLCLRACARARGRGRGCGGVRTLVPVLRAYMPACMFCACMWVLKIGYIPNPMVYHHFPY